MKAIIIAGGTPPSKELFIQELSEPSVLICADRGADCAFKYNIVPDYLLGDFDSIDKKILDFFSKQKCTIDYFSKDKDYTDTELALIKAKELKVSKITFLGCTGSRLDHTLGNLGLLLKCLKNNIEAYIKDDNNTICIVNKSIQLKGKTGENFSLLAYDTPVTGLTIEGAKYNLYNYDLNIGDGLTISNEFLECKVNINFGSGNLLIIKSMD